MDKMARIWRDVERCYSCQAVLVGHGGPAVASDFIDNRKYETFSQYMLLCCTVVS